MRTPKSPEESGFNRNDKRVLFGTINVRNGHRILTPYGNMRQESFQDFMRVVRRCYRGKAVWTLPDSSTAHRALKSRQLAEALHIKLVWLPKQCPELNAMHHRWQQAKADISSNHQYVDIDQRVAFAMKYRLQLTRIRALRRAGILSKNAWLKRVREQTFATSLRMKHLNCREEL